jgi:ribosomal-protein-alanine N-acetyltransferase
MVRKTGELCAGLMLGVAGKGEKREKCGGASVRTRGAQSAIVKFVMPAMIQTERLILRTPEAFDEAAFMRARETNREHLERWEPLPAPNAVGAFQRFLEQGDTPQGRRFLIFAKEPLVQALGDGVLGQVSFSNIIRGPLQQAFVGYWLVQAAEGKGIMRESLHAAVTHALNADGLGLHRVECNVMPGNARSLQLARRVGFREEGFSPRYLRIRGVWEDHVRLAVTGEEWNDARAERNG